MRSWRFLGISFFFRPQCGLESSSRSWASAAHAHAGEGQNGSERAHTCPLRSANDR